MATETLLAEVMVVLFSAIFSYIACYMVYKRFSVAVWGYIAAFVPRIPVAIVAATGGTNLMLFSWLSHTVGVFVYAIFLAVADILLLEIAFIRVIRPISFALPKSLQTAVKAESMLSRLQDYHAVPRPERVQWVYGAAVIAGMINLVFVLAFGLI
jgi:hypothetical protein